MGTPADDDPTGPTPSDVPIDLAVDDARDLVAAIVQLAQMADRVLPQAGAGIGRRLHAHLGDGELRSTSARFPEMDRATFQLALDAACDGATSWELIGLTRDIGNYGDVSISSFMGGRWHGPGEVSPQFDSLPIDVDAHLDCLRSGIVLTEHDGTRVALLAFVSDRGMVPETVVEVVSSDRTAAQGFLDRLRSLMDERNVLRGKTVSFTFGRHGDFGLDFVAVPPVERSEVVLDDAVLTAIEEHTLGISTHVDELRARGQHVKRGLLLHGPPGTGKTHTISYLLGAMEGRTSVILSGAAVGAVGQAGSIARALQPATIVIEDVDLIGMDRSLPGGDHNPMLFQLLNEMDGLAADADVVFVLTTNRVDLLEPALAARPGRVDQAVEIGLPDAGARRRLLALYAGDDVADDVAERTVMATEGVTASFVKELARRATLRALRADTAVSDELEPALVDLTEHATPILRSTLAPAHPTTGG